MRVHSYADPLVGAVRLTLDGRFRDIDDLMEKLGRNGPDREFRLNVFRWAWYAHQSLFIHEWAHILQVSTYPYLLLRAARAALVITEAGNILLRKPGIHDLPLQWQMGPWWAASRLFSVSPIQLIFRDDHLEVVPCDAGRVRRGAISENDLVEEDATVFQYRATIGSSGNGASYLNWLMERPHYCRVFNILTRHFGADPALVLIPILTRVAFQTTRPLLAMAECLALLKADQSLIPANEDDADLTEAAFKIILESNWGILSEDTVTKCASELEDPKGVLPASSLQIISRDNPSLPVTVLTVNSLRDGSAEEPFLLKVLRHPWEYFDRRRRDINDAMLPYVPPVTTVRPNHPDYRLGWTVLVLSPLMAGHPVPGSQQVTYDRYIPQLLQVREIWKAVLDGARGPHPVCPHDNCRLHGSGLCHGWSSISENIQDCRFPDFFETYFRHRVSDDGKRLEPSPTHPNQQNQ